MRKIIFISTTFLFICLISFAQTKYQPRHLSFKVKRLAHKLQKYDKVTGPRIGKSAAKSDQYREFEKLKLKATENELCELTNHKSPIVRAFALTGLTDINSAKTLEIMNKNQNDTVTIAQQFGCIGADNTVIGYMLPFIKSYIKNNNVTLTQQQSNLIQKLSDDHMAWADRRRNNPPADKDDDK
jgi:hypothetical protein